MSYPTVNMHTSFDHQTSTEQTFQNLYSIPFSVFT